MQTLETYFIIYKIIYAIYRHFIFQNYIRFDLVYVFFYNFEFLELTIENVIQGLP